MDAYLIAKTLHILSSTVLFGTGIGTAFQMTRAMATDRAATAADVSGGVVLADWLFTTPAGVVQPVTGLWLIHETGFSLTEPWLIAAYGLYSVAFGCWAPVVHLQMRIRDLCRNAPDPEIPPAAKRLYRIWVALGVPAFAALVAIFWLMVSKPGFN